MKILFINPVIREYQAPYSFPIGLGIIAAIMRKEGHDVVVYDQNALRTSTQEMFTEIKKYKSVDMIASGGLITAYANLKKILPGLKEAFPKAHIVIGGGVTVEPDMIFGNMPVDYCVHGEGEQTFLDLCIAIEKQEKDFSYIDGISYIENDQVVTTNPRDVEKDLNRFPMPAYDLFPSELYFKNNLLHNRLNFDIETQRCATIMWSRGCPYQCSFCWRMMGPGTRFRSIDLVIDEIKYLRSTYGVDSYLFVDECINAHKKKTKTFIRRLIDEKLDAPWYSSARVNLFDSEMAGLFRQSGCVGLNFGIESASPKMLKVMNKKATPEQASEAVQLAMKNGITPVCTFIFGMPGETKTTIKESVRWIKKNKVQRAAFFFITPFPGCDLYNQPFVMERIIDKYGDKDRFFSAIGDVTDLAINLTDFSDSQLLRLQKNAKLQVSLFAGYQWIRLLKEPKRWIDALQKLIQIFRSA